MLWRRSKSSIRSESSRGGKRPEGAGLKIQRTMSSNIRTSKKLPPVHRMRHCLSPLNYLLFVHIMSSIDFQKRQYIQP
ncbi:hypothetical protein CJF31_00003123 [Rutstroemia sp. NJR-2017a BVV2]|nr:hypothetical protein CJF31_00001915 [Rutstroemia sp. NJR-2017a BVV2]PQE18472.1 hypothetical protein CJF31_00003123 [Rutstroemia sp. NJR-2017a BVV2]